MGPHEIQCPSRTQPVAISPALSVLTSQTVRAVYPSARHGPTPLHPTRTCATLTSRPPTMPSASPRVPSVSLPLLLCGTSGSGSPAPALETCIGPPPSRRACADAAGTELTCGRHSASTIGVANEVGVATASESLGCLNALQKTGPSRLRPLVAVVAVPS